MYYLNNETIRLLVALLYSEAPLSVVEINDCYGFPVFTNEIGCLKLKPFFKFTAKSKSTPRLSTWDDMAAHYKKKSSPKFTPEPRPDYFITLCKKSGIIKFLDTYLDRFENGELLSSEPIYPYRRHLDIYLPEWQNLFEEYGHNILLDGNRAVGPSHQLRFCEFVLLLQKKGYLAITSAHWNSLPAYYDHQDGREIPARASLKLNLKFKISPQQIAESEKSFSLKHGDIRVDEKQRIAYYKKNVFQPKRPQNRSFQILCYLMKQPETDISTKKLYRKFENSAAAKNLGPTLIKKTVKGWAKEIKDSLGITKDKARTMDISITGNSIRLTHTGRRAL